MTADNELDMPALFAISDFPGTVGDYVDALWRDYSATLAADIRLWGLPVVAYDGKAGDGRDTTFWHLITDSTRQRTEATRQLSLRRCAHLPRVRWTLERLAEGSIRVVWWRERRGRICVAPVDWSMVVMLRRHNGVYELSSAYPVKPHRRLRVFSRAAARWAAQDFYTPAPPHTAAVRCPARPRRGRTAAEA